MKQFQTRTLLLALFAAATPVLPAAADGASSLNGKWKIQRSAAGNDSEQECTFTQKNSDVTGTCSSPGRGTVQIAGKVEGKNISLTYKSDSQGGEVTVVYKGSFESDDKISGSVTALEFSIEGAFSGTRQAK